MHRGMGRSAGWIVAFTVGSSGGLACSSDRGGPSDSGARDSAGSGETGGFFDDDDGGGGAVSGALTAAVPEFTGGCGEVEVAVEQAIPTLVLLVDRSGSMTQDFQGLDRWDAVYETLMDPQNGVVSRLESQVRFGLTLYSSASGFEGGECPILTRVAPAIGNRDAIDAAYAAQQPLDETPTGESVAAVAKELAALDVDGPKGIVLATDGEPDTCAMPDPQNGQDVALDAVASAFSQGIRTFAISVGNEVGEQHLQDLANLGVGRQLASPEPAPFYRALNAAELVAAFDDIIGTFTCEFLIDGVLDISQGCDGRVVLDGALAQCGTDWEVVDGRTLRFLGDACESLGDGLPHSIEAAWPCGAIVPIP